MSDIKLFQIEKNKSEVLKTVLTNTIKMLTERGLLKGDKIKSNVDKLLSKDATDAIYEIELDKDVELEGDDKDNGITSKIFALKIIPKKITAVSKTHGINEFLNKYKNNSKMIIVKSISKKANQYIVGNYPNTQIFMEEELMINIVDNVLVPKHEVLPREEAEVFYQKYNCKKKNMPKILTEDPVAKYYDMKPGDICKITRPSETSGFFRSYRLVVKGSLK